jgi:hypothetical protein
MQTRQRASARPARPPKTARGATLLALVATLALVAPAWATCGEIEPLSLLPADQTCPGWSRDGEPLTAHTPAELAEIIDGSAFLYVSYGFVAAAFQNYAAEIAGEPVVATLVVFNQDTSENAQALYQDPGSGSGAPVLDWPGSGAARVLVSFGSVTFQFYQDCFYSSIVLLPGSESTVPEARCLAEAVLDLIEGATPTEATSWGMIKTAFE